MAAVDRLAGISPDLIGAVVAMLTDDEVIEIYDHWIGNIAHYVIDEFADPIALHKDVDSMALVCRLYRRYMAAGLGPVKS